MIDFDAEMGSFADIVAKDSRYDARAYVLLDEVLATLGGDDSESEHFSAADILEEFKNQALDEFGPMAFAVLAYWGLKCTGDIGNMLRNLVEVKRVCKDSADDYTDFEEVYDFEEAFRGPYKI